MSRALSLCSFVPLSQSLDFASSARSRLQARFLHGARFDARVEVHVGYNESSASPLEPYPTAPMMNLLIQVNGNESEVVPIGDALLSISGAPTAPVSSTNTFVSLAWGIPAMRTTRYAYATTWRNLRAAAPGKHKIVLMVNGQRKAVVDWTVRPVAPVRKAKNVILVSGYAGKPCPGGSLYHGRAQYVSIATSYGQGYRNHSTSPRSSLPTVVMSASSRLLV